MLIAPLQLLASMLIIAGTFALMFEIKYFADFSVEIYLGRLIATAIGFIVLFLTYFDFGKNHPVLLIHLLLITIITSFGSIILKVPESIFINSQLLSLIIFTSALFLSWDVKNQIIVAIYYNLLFSASILLNNHKIYFLPSFFAAFIFVIFISILSIIATSINFKLRSQVFEKSIEAKNYLDNASEGIFRISLEGDILSVNPALTKLLKFNSENQLIENMNFKELFFDSLVYQKFLEQTRESGFYHDKEIVLINYLKEKLSVLINARQVVNQYGTVVAIEGSILDITERVEATKKIKEYNHELKKLNTSKDKFFSILAHDLISPFTSLIGYSELLNNEVEKLSKEEIKEFAEDINLVAIKSHNLLENLLSWSSIQSNRIQFNPKITALNPIVEDVLLLSTGNATSKGINLYNEVPKDIEVLADFNMLNTILRNLTSNAIKFTNSGGKISVGFIDLEDFYEIYVADTGVGMSEEDQSKLFKIDVHHSEIGTNNEKGTGLGLVLCAEFVAKHGGKITVDSHIGIGSKFVFTLKKNSDIRS